MNTAHGSARMKLRSRLRLAASIAALMLLACALRGAAQPTAAAPHARVTLLADRTAVEPDPTHRSEPPHLGLLFELDPGWHIYWTNAGDSGEPPAVQWTLPPGVGVGPLQFPAPRRLPLGPLMDYGYEGRVLLPAELHLPATLPRTPLTVAADVSWLVCRQACVPGRAHLTLALPVGPGAPSAAAPLFAAAHAAMPRVLPADAQVLFEAAPSQIRLAVLTGHRIDAAQFFPADPGVIANAAPQSVLPRPDGVLLTLRRDDAAAAAPRLISGVLRLPDGTACFVRARPGAIPPPPAVVSVAALRPLLLALAGGILLNLMPCVFPVIFLKALALVQSGAEERRVMRRHGLAYAAGILVSFWIVVAVLLALRAGGRSLGWGFQFQSPVFVALMALLLFFLGLALAGMFEIGLTLTSAGSRLAARQGLGGSFFTGVLAMVVATPCAAPFLGTAIGFALVQPAWVALGVFTALGLGLALPYLVLTFEPAWTRLLPRPGPWMEVLKQATAVPVFATVIWLVWLAVRLAGVTALPGLLLALLLLAIAGWILGRWPARRPATAAAALVLLLAVTGAVSWVRAVAVSSSAGGREAEHPGGPGSGHAGSDRSGSDRPWQAFSPGLVDRYQQQGRPVFVDFTADWCLSCQVNERVVLERADVRGALDRSGIELVRADWTRHDAGIARALASLGRSSIPTYALYPGIPGAPATLLPEVLTPGLVVRAVEGLGRTAGTGRAGPSESSSLK